MTGVHLLEELDRANRSLQEKGYKASDRQALTRLPRYGYKWRWIEMLKVGYVFSCDLPDYDVAANARMGEIIEELNNE